jgi:hypothetical protein
MFRRQIVASAIGIWTVPNHKFFQWYWTAAGATISRPETHFRLIECGLTLSAFLSNTGLDEKTEYTQITSGKEKYDDNTVECLMKYLPNV